MDHITTWCVYTRHQTNIFKILCSIYVTQVDVLYLSVNHHHLSVTNSVLPVKNPLACGSAPTQHMARTRLHEPTQPLMCVPRLGMCMGLSASRQLHMRQQEARTDEEQTLVRLYFAVYTVTQCYRTCVIKI